MQWASALSRASDLQTAASHACTRVLQELGSRTPTLVLVFASAAYGRSLVELPRWLRAYFPRATMLGCVAAGVIGEGEEAEEAPALSVMAAHLPDAYLSAFHATPWRLPTPDDPPSAWVRLVGLQPSEVSAVLLLADPAFTALPELLAGLDYAYPQAVKVGGLASGNSFMGPHLLLLADDVLTEGAVGVAIGGPVAVDVVLAQACRPVGEPRRVTRCHEHVLLELDGEPPMEYLRRLYGQLDPRDQQLLRTQLFLGIAVDFVLTPQELAEGDFLIRNLLGAQPQDGSLVVGERLREGQLVQFHVRDAVSAAHRLREQLDNYRACQQSPPRGALLFQCTGRGSYLYGRPNHDSSLFRELVGPVPLGGFFCNGEIAPLRGTTYLHGYTSCFALFRPR